MSKEPSRYVQQALKRIVRWLLKLTLLQLSVLFVTAAVLVSMAIVAVIDWSWDGRFNAELEFAGVITPFLDALLIVGLLAAVLAELRGEVERRKAAEESARELNAALEAKVAERAGQLLEAQEELVRREKLAVLGQVADTVGHELRNPLGVINNAAYFLQTVLADA
jgi:C4-dicarboxylate-specific signal transduction histidine kinase